MDQVQEKNLLSTALKLLRIYCLGRVQRIFLLDSSVQKGWVMACFCCVKIPGVKDPALFNFGTVEWLA